MDNAIPSELASVLNQLAAYLAGTELGERVRNGTAPMHEIRQYALDMIDQQRAIAGDERVVSAVTRAIYDECNGEA